MRARTSPLVATRPRKISTPERPGSIRSLLSTASEPDRFSYRKSNASVHSFIGANRRSHSETGEIPEDEIASISTNRCSYRDSGLSFGRNSQRFSTMEETRRKITALETVPSPPLSNSNLPSKSSTPYSSPSGTPILEHVEKGQLTPVRMRDRESRESRDSAYASGRLNRKGGPPYHTLQGVFSLGEEDLSPDASTSDGSPKSPIFLSDILDESSFNNNGKPSTTGHRKISLPARMITDSQQKEQESHIFTRSMSTRERDRGNKGINSVVKNALLTWEEATWPHWDPNDPNHEMPDHETIL